MLLTNAKGIKYVFDTYAISLYIAYTEVSKLGLFTSFSLSHFFPHVYITVFISVLTHWTLSRQMKIYTFQYDYFYFCTVATKTYSVQSNFLPLILTNDSCCYPLNSFFIHCSGILKKYAYIYVYMYISFWVFSQRVGFCFYCSFCALFVKSIFSSTFGSPNVRLMSRLCLSGFWYALYFEGSFIHFST